MIWNVSIDFLLAKIKQCWQSEWALSLEVVSASVLQTVSAARTTWLPYTAMMFGDVAIWQLRKDVSWRGSPWIPLIASCKSNFNPTLPSAGWVNLLGGVTTIWSKIPKKVVRAHFFECGFQNCPTFRLKQTQEAISGKAPAKRWRAQTPSHWAHLARLA